MAGSAVQYVPSWYLVVIKHSLSLDSYTGWQFLSLWYIVVTFHLYTNIIIQHSEDSKKNVNWCSSLNFGCPKLHMKPNCTNADSARCCIPGN